MLPFRRRSSFVFSDAEYRTGVRRLYIAFTVVITILIIGAMGIKLLSPETSFTKAIYFSVITITTIGFSEVVDVQHIEGGMWFITIYALFGMGSMLWWHAPQKSIQLQ
ncbi:MAG: potassium channel family protein [Planctomycetota bacterium]|nr:potassium channel family protein [Planctomycetota bacterium]